jgi:signal transduction histidine kinase
MLWFATRNGFARIDPTRLTRNPLPPPVIIRSMTADERSISTYGHPRLPALTKDLRFDYTALSLTIPERVRFRYRLEGTNQDWQNAGTGRQAFYRDLSPGKYRFRVLASNNDGVWNLTGAALEFTIAPAWYQTAWFRALCIAAGAWLIWAMYRWRVRQIAAAMGARFDERLAERTRLAGELHDTLLQTIQASKMVADDALDQPADAVRLRCTVERLAEWLGRATEEGRAALNALRTSTAQRNDLAEALRRVTEDPTVPDSMQVALVVAGAPRPMHPIVQEEIYRIGFESIRNACAHSKGTRLDIELHYARDLVLRIADDGKGIDAEVADKGKAGHFGLRGMRERAARIGGKLTLVSSATGTEITLSVPGKVIFRSARRGLFRQRPPFDAD